jgi:hypothetical protein
MLSRTLLKTKNVIHPPSSVFLVSSCRLIIEAQQTPHPSSAPHRRCSSASRWRGTHPEKGPQPETHPSVRSRPCHSYNPISRQALDVKVSLLSRRSMWVWIVKHFYPVKNSETFIHAFHQPLGMKNIKHWFTVLFQLLNYLIKVKPSLNNIHIAIDNHWIIYYQQIPHLHKP